MLTGFNHVTLAIRDIDRSFSFYRNILMLKPLVKWDQGAYFLIGPESATDFGFWFCLNVEKNLTPSSSYTHYAFSVSEKDFPTISERIITSGALIFKANTSPGKSLYFLDPDGHKLEIHVGSWLERVETKKANLGDWKNVEWFV